VNPRQNWTGGNEPVSRVIGKAESTLTELRAFVAEMEAAGAGPDAPVGADIRLMAGRHDSGTFARLWGYPGASSGPVPPKPPDGPGTGEVGAGSGQVDG
jgi:hypothetical protein